MPALITSARALVAVAGSMGLAGVMLAAAGTHLGGGDVVHTAASFLSLHATIVFGLAVATQARIGSPRLWLIAGGVLAAGTIVFAADLALLGLFQSRPLPVAAPIGGVLMIAGWGLVIAGAAVRGS